MKYHTWGSWGSNSVSKVSNQFAAMPSLHIGWSLWAGLTLFMLSGKWWIRALGLLYPVVTFFVIIGTANHYTLDAVGGVVALLGGYLIQWLLTGATSTVPAHEDIPDHIHRHAANARAEQLANLLATCASRLRCAASRLSQATSMSS